MTYQKYKGKKLESFIDEDNIKLDAYFPSDELKDAVNLAIMLNRPLILSGEPGCGKTRLAEAVAFEIHHHDYKEHFFPIYVRSTTKAQDIKYTFDHLQRLRDANLVFKDAKDVQEEDIALRKYLRLGTLGRAFEKSQQGAQSIILIDEIDKADIDFPNDLLRVLDEQQFTIDELKEDHPDREVTAQYPPLVIITSNNEKDLPGAFLRRCIFHQIKFPGYETLRRIMEEKIRQIVANMLEIGPSKEEQRVKATAQAFKENIMKHMIKKFGDIRKEMQNAPNADLIPSTSALVDWTTAIFNLLYDDEITFEEGAFIKNGKKLEKLPAVGSLLKTINDFEQFAYK